MSDQDPSLDEMGAVDAVVVELPGAGVTGELVPSLLDLVDRELIRVLDILLVVKAADGSHTTMIPEDLAEADVGDLGPLMGAASGLFGDEDGDAVAAIMQPDSRALVLMYENLWSLPFANAARAAGGQLIGSLHIPIPAIMAELDALEA